MKPASSVPGFARCMVATAALLVPRCQRDDWKREWKAELWHVCNSGIASRGASRREIFSFTAGSFPDAWYIRRDGHLAQHSFTLQRPSAIRCAALLAGWALAGLIVCALLPGARRALLAACCSTGKDLVTVSAGGFAGTQFPTIRLGTYREWQSETRDLFSGIAYYRVATKRVHVSGYQAARMTLAMGTPNLLEFLNVGRPQFGGQKSGAAGEAQLFLTRTAWQHMDKSQSEVSSHTTKVAGETVELAGILADDDWRLPGGAQGILLETAEVLRVVPENTRGFVIASMRHTETGRLRRGWAYIIDRTGTSENGYTCIRLSYLDNEPVSVFLLALLLAVIALPATTPLQLGEYPRTSCSLSVMTNLRRWSFLAVKFLLATTSIGLWSVALAYGLSRVSLSTSIYLQLTIGFPALLFAFRWILHDQRNRCPHCLRLLSSPARVGQPSHNFLSWNGTELICTVGHGLLHIPELPTSWCSTQRWLSLDSSWLCLFQEGGPAVAEGT